MTNNKNKHADKSIVIDNNEDLEDKIYNLNKISSYNKNLKDNNAEILLKFIHLLNEYFFFFNERIIIKNKNDKLKFFILEKGILNLFNNFKILIYYTKNVNLTEYYCKKSIYFYIEYVEQIFNEQNLFLNLTSRDAMLFSCKKTIFDINSEIKNKLKVLPEDVNKINNLINYLDIFKKRIFDFFNKPDLYSINNSSSNNSSSNNSSSNNLFSSIPTHELIQNLEILIK